MKRELVVTCKFCHRGDLESNCHKDKYTAEFYHDACRPQSARRLTLKSRRASLRKGKEIEGGEG